MPFREVLTHCNLQLTLLVARTEYYVVVCWWQVVPSGTSDHSVLTLRVCVTCTCSMHTQGRFPGAFKFVLLFSQMAEALLQGNTTAAVAVLASTQGTILIDGLQGANATAFRVAYWASLVSGCITICQQLSQCPLCRSRSSSRPQLQQSA